MGLFSRLAIRQSVAWGWQPEVPARDWQPASADVQVLPGAAMDDDGCAGDDAYGVTFILASEPGSTITVWTYAVYAAPDAPGEYQTGWRCEYRAGNQEQVAYGTEDPEFYDTLDAANRAAWESAHGLASVTGWDDAPSWLDWDGAPW